jgi:hypothetical protein
MRVNIRCAGSVSSAQVGRSLRDRRITGNPLPVRPNALDSRNRSRPNRVPLRPRSCGLGETRPTCALDRPPPKSCALQSRTLTYVDAHGQPSDLKTPSGLARTKSPFEGARVAPPETAAANVSQRLAYHRLAFGVGLSVFGGRFHDTQTADHPVATTRDGRARLIPSFNPIPSARV